MAALQSETKPCDGVLAESLMKTNIRECTDTTAQVTLSTSLPCHEQRTVHTHVSMYKHTHAHTQTHTNIHMSKYKYKTHYIHNTIKTNTRKINELNQYKKFHLKDFLDLGIIIILKVRISS